MIPLAVLTFLLLTFPILPAGSQDAPPLQFDSSWSLSGDGTRVAQSGGRDVLEMRNGRAIRPDVELLDGTIDFDLKFSRLRSFVYLQFRMQTDGEYEEIYFRPHKDDLPDSIQYSPVYRGTSNWQLFHEEGGTAQAALPADRWNPVRLVLQGSKAALFFGDMERPVMLIPLHRQPGAGYLALRSFAPEHAAEGVPVAEYADVRVRPGYVPFDFSGKAEPKPTPSGVIPAWSVSDSFAPPQAAIVELPQGGGWKTLRADSSGLLILGQHLDRPKGVNRAATLARIRIHSQDAKSVAFQFGFSDEVSVFLNGRLLYSDDESYSFTMPQRVGLIELPQATLYLPLVRGENEVVLAVADVFGGWGVTGRIEDREGLRIEP